jgi:hypothetical protein
LESESLRFGEVCICAQCKPAYLRGLEHGDAPTRPAFRDLTPLTRWLRWLLIAGVVMSATFAATEVVELFRLHREGTPPDYEDFSREDLAYIGLGLVGLILWVATTVVFLCWNYFAAVNVRALGAKHLRFSPGWCIGWHFIPIANLWKPYQAMREVWQASTSPAAWSEAPVPALLPRWWAWWVLDYVLIITSILLSVTANITSQYILAGWVALLASLCDCFLTLAALTLVRGLWQAQQQSRAQAGSP